VFFLYFVFIFSFIFQLDDDERIIVAEIQRTQDHCTPEDIQKILDGRLEAKDAVEDSDFYNSDASRAKLPMLINPNVDGCTLDLKLKGDIETVLREVLASLNKNKKKKKDLTPQEQTKKKHLKELMSRRPFSLAALSDGPVSIVDLVVAAARYSCATASSVFKAGANGLGPVVVTLLVNCGMTHTAQHYEVDAASGFAKLLKGQKVWFFWKGFSRPGYPWTRLPDHVCVQREGQTVTVPAGCRHEVVTTTDGAVLFGTLRDTPESVEWKAQEAKWWRSMTSNSDLSVAPATIPGVALDTFTDREFADRERFAFYPVGAEGLMPELTDYDPKCEAHLRKNKNYNAKALAEFQIYAMRFHRDGESYIADPAMVKCYDEEGHTTYASGRAHFAVTEYNKMAVVNEPIPGTTANVLARATPDGIEYVASGIVRKGVPLRLHYGDDYPRDYLVGQPAPEATYTAVEEKTEAPGKRREKGPVFVFVCKFSGTASCYFCFF
jgi:hypothetical protein